MLRKVPMIISQTFSQYQLHPNYDEHEDISSTQDQRILTSSSNNLYC